MKIVIDNKSKIEMFTTVFQLLKNCSSLVKIDFSSDRIYVQGMDKSHVCLFQLDIKSPWFSSYEYIDGQDAKYLVLDSNSFCMILSSTNANNILLIETLGDDPDSIHIEMTYKEQEKGQYYRSFHLPLIELDQDYLDIPDIDYDVDIIFKTKQLHELTSQLMSFGDILEIKCNEQGIDLKTGGDSGSMKATIPVDDLTEFSIAEGKEIELTYSLIYIHKMCLTTKLSKEVDIRISENYPIRIRYELEQDSSLMFFVAPKIE